MTGWQVTADLARESLIDAMYDRVGRMLALRSLAAADAGDWVPLARLVYSGSVSTVRSTVSDFAYYATSCADRVVEGADTDAAAYLDTLRHSPLADTPAAGVYLSSAACHAWPVRPAASPPEAVPTRASFPVVLLAASADPITPATHAERIFQRYSPITDTYLIETQNGPHVTFGRGAACPDDAVVALLVDGTRPSSTRSTCPGRDHRAVSRLPELNARGRPDRVPGGVARSRVARPSRLPGMGRHAAADDRLSIRRPTRSPDRPRGGRRRRAHRCRRLCRAP